MTDLGDMLRIIRQAKPRPECKITCGLAIYSWIRHRPAAPVVHTDPAPPALAGIPIVLDPRMPRGRWSYTENGEEVQSGQVGNGERVWYQPVTGQFVTTEFGPLVEVLDGAGGATDAPLG